MTVMIARWTRPREVWRVLCQRKSSLGKSGSGPPEWHLTDVPFHENLQTTHQQLHSFYSQWCPIRHHCPYLSSSERWSDGASRVLNSISPDLWRISHPWAKTRFLTLYLLGGLRKPAQIHQPPPPPCTGLPDGHGRITPNRNSSVDKIKLRVDYKESGPFLCTKNLICRV